MWTQGRAMCLCIITKSLLSARPFTRFWTYQFIFYQDYCQGARKRPYSIGEELKMHISCLFFIKMTNCCTQCTCMESMKEHQNIHCYYQKHLHKAACLSFMLLVRWIGQRKEIDIGNSGPFNKFGHQNAICRSILAE